MKMAQPFVVILRPLGLGDFLTGIPAYRAIARAFPEHQIVLAAPPALGPLAAWCGAVDRVHPTQPLEPLDSELHGADVAIDLHGRGPASHRILLAARPRRLIAFANDAISQSAGGARWIAAEHEVARWCRMLAHAGIPADPADLDLRLPPDVMREPQGDRTVIHPAAASEARCWPVERWAAVARAEAARGRRVTITGSPGERPRAVEIARRSGVPGIDVAAGQTDLVALAALVASAGRIVCGDTGVAHLATAMRTPSVLLFGPMSPALWGPPARPIHHVLWTGRRGDPHGTRIDAGLLDITVSDVVAALRSLDAIAFTAAG